MLLGLSFSFFACSIYQIIHSYWDISIDIPEEMHIKFLEDSPFDSLILNLDRQSSLSANDIISTNIEINIDPNVGNYIHRISAVFVNQEYENISNEFSHKLQKFYHENSFSVILNNNTNYAKIKGMIQFYHVEKIGVYIFAFDKHEQLIGYIFHRNVWPFDYNPLDERMAVDSVRNGIRIEGLTFAALGLAIIMFLLEIGIKPRD